MFRKVLFTLWCLVALYKALAKPVQMMERGDPEYDEMPGVQFMITRQMRGVLEGKLKYLAEEVDCMQPEIARAVIEKKLARPAGGMPQKWRIPSDQSYDEAYYDSYDTTNGATTYTTEEESSSDMIATTMEKSSSGMIAAIKEKCSNLIPKCLKMSKMRIAQASIALIGGYFLLNSNLLEQAFDSISSLFGKKEVYQPPKRNTNPLFPAFITKPKSQESINKKESSSRESKRSKNSLDMDSFNKLQRTSFSSPLNWFGMGQKSYY